MASTIKGMSTVLRNLNRELKKIKNDSLKGLILVAKDIRRDMDKIPPLIPIDIGHLRASWFIDARHTWRGPSVRFGFTAEYAWFVHEMVGADFTSPQWRYGPEYAARGPRGGKRKWITRRPGAGAKFLEASIKRNAPHALKTIRKVAMIK